VPVHQNWKLLRCIFVLTLNQPRKLTKFENQFLPPQRVESLVTTTMEAATDDSTKNDWKIYRTRFLVRAKQLTEYFAFTDALGRDHSGEPGDYLVESSDGIARVAPKAIFEDIYVPMPSSYQNRKLTGNDETAVPRKKSYGYVRTASA
jgi:hypothetical protein